MTELLRRELPDMDAPTLAEMLRDLSMALYLRANKLALEKGIIIADTKFEFGLRPDGTLVLADEFLTPDSSRFWPLEGYQPGRSQPSFDKQYVRDWAAATGWDKQPPAPELPHDVVEMTIAKYLEVYRRLFGPKLSALEPSVRRSAAI